MKKIDALTEEFKNKYEAFLIGCSALEELQVWDTETYGEMGAFYLNDFTGVILRLIVADGVVSSKEAAFLRENFGLEYTAEELEAVYESCGEEIGNAFDEQLAGGIVFMRSLNEGLAGAYKELLGLICDIVAASDGAIAPAEIEEAKRLKELVK